MKSNLKILSSHIVWLFLLTSLISVVKAQTATMDLTNASPYKQMIQQTSAPYNYVAEEHLEYYTTSGFSSPGNFTVELVDPSNTSIVYAILPNVSTLTGSIPLKATVAAGCGANPYNRNLILRITDHNTNTVYYSNNGKQIQYSRTGLLVSSSGEYEFYKYHCPGSFSLSLYGAVYCSPYTNQDGDWEYFDENVQQWTTTLPGSATPRPRPTSTVDFTLDNVSQNGDYRLVMEVGSGSGLTKEAILFHVQDAPNVSIYEIGSGNSGPFYLSPSTGITQYSLKVTTPAFQTYTSYQWYRNGQIISGATSNSYSATQKGIYKVIVNGTCGQETSNEIIIGDDCSNTNSATFIDGTVTTASLNGLYNSSNYIFDGNIEVMTGNSATITNCDVNMLDGTIITVKGGASLTIDNATLHSCLQWAGIYVEDGGSVLVQNNSSITDAFVAIYKAGNNGTCQVINSNFSDNHTSIATEGRPSPSTSIDIMGSTFNNIDLHDAYMLNNQSNTNIINLINTYNSLHTYISAVGTRDININNGSTFDGLDETQIDNSWNISNYPEVYAIRTIASENILITDNVFTKAYFASIYGSDVDNIEATTNSFSCNPVSLLFYGRAILIENESNNIGLYDNSFTNLRIGAELTTSENIKIRNSTTGNSFITVLEGVILKQCGLFDVSNNQFSGGSPVNVETGIQVYKDDYSTQTTDSKVGCNTLSSQKYGIVISPIMNPAIATSVSVNSLVSGTPQMIAIINNEFNGNDICILGSDKLVDQYQGKDPANVFNGTFDWDVKWVENVSPLNGNASYAFGYYNNPSSYIFNTSGTLSKSASLLNGLVFDDPSNSINWDNEHIDNSGGYIGTHLDFMVCNNYAPLAKSVTLQPSKINIDNAIVISPNPASIAISISNLQKESQAYEIYNLNGQLVGKGNCESGSYVSLQSLSEGIYLIKIITSSGYMSNVKFIKQ